jgi:hypothetical protein
MTRVGLTARFAAWRDRPVKRPRGGTSRPDSYLPPEPVPAPGEAPASPASRFSDAGVAPPRPLVWVGTAASGAAVWSSPIGNSVGQRMWRELRAAAEVAGAWPVLSGPAPLPGTWRLAEGRSAGAVEVPDGRGLLESARATAAPAEPGLRTRLEPTADAVVETDLAAGYLALVEGVVGWQVPLTVGFSEVGGWSPLEHSAVLRHLADRYGAELVALTGNGMGLAVARPPRTSEEAYAAAEELYAYCPAIVTQGVRTLWGLATTMVVSSAWSLRWSPE